ncbi:hypothetical protein [Maridesulfovibrio hydrothermalis]|uniref:Uncharacterized protein n=1 Tax=Maridesulfovibrio hydrothermalis AM13 = DSM 14728 TaxID=1121451 RepID=L0RCV4_9BACT|nr:hypothetical protein [Maridesulfovibrio hydrothermalis]CCO24047.1 conserved protein of unknown function [Maridesulfovibrio hydrothermalis AM13 = DSM 14728]
MTKMTREEEFKIIQKIRELDAEGKHEEAYELRKRLPLPPHLAMALKDTIGVNELKKANLDLTEANEKYGENWLTR